MADRLIQGQFAARIHSIASRLLVITVASMFGVAFTTPAAATAIYQAEASGTLTFDSLPSGLLISGDSQVTSLNASATGAIGTFAAAFGDADYVPSPLLLSQEAQASGQAIPDAIPGSQADSFYMTEGYIEFANTTSARLLINLSFTYSLIAQAMVDDPMAIELASAESLVQLWLNDELLVNQLIDADTAMGDAGEVFGSTIFQYEFGVPAGETYRLDLYVNANGLATSTSVSNPVPIPGTLPLLAVGVFGLLVSQKRRRHGVS